jgi:hypothetical protein
MFSARVESLMPVIILSWAAITAACTTERAVSQIDSPYEATYAWHSAINNFQTVEVIRLTSEDVVYLSRRFLAMNLCVRNLSTRLIGAAGYCGGTRR